MNKYGVPHWSLFQKASYVEFYRRHHVKIVGGLFVLTFVLGAVFSAYFLGGSSSPGQQDEPAGVTEASTEGPTMWTCSMHPQIQRTKPGDCPICGMDLIPVAKTAGGMRTLTVTPAARALMNVAVSPVERRFVEHKIRMEGKIDYDETKIGYITARVAGRLDQMYVDFTGTKVEKGFHMVYIYSEQLYTAQEELIRAVKFARDRQARPSSVLNQIDYAESAREKLRLLGLTDEQIKQIEQQSEPTDHLTLYADVSGIVIEKLKQEGDRVSVGDRIYTIVDLSKVWVHLDAYESDLPWLKYGQEVTITTEAYPGDRFYGRINFIQPVLDDKTRTVKVRVNVPNPQGKLKPEMFVHATATARVAVGGRVMDPSLAGKWISPMHPEIVKDEPGACDICGMPLVRAETLGYVAPDTGPEAKPLVIPYSAALVTGTRAVVYVELPPMNEGVEAALQRVSGDVASGELPAIRDAFAAFGKILDRPYEYPGTGYARNEWNRFADELGQEALRGQRAGTIEEAKQTFSQLEMTMNRLREVFAPPGQPTFEGREIVLGPRAGEYYLVRHGLSEGEMVVTNGNFKIDAEIQIQAKPSMMTPEGGGGGGHDHGGGDKKPKGDGDEHAEHAVALPSEFLGQLHDLNIAYQQVGEAVEKAELDSIRGAFVDYGDVLKGIDGEQLMGHPRMVWREFSMLLGNDVVEGLDVQQLDEADRIYLSLKGHMRRLREQFQLKQEPPVQQIDAPSEFRQQLLTMWDAYLPLQQFLAADDFPHARQSLASFETALATVEPAVLDSRAQLVWKKEERNLNKVVESLRAAEDIEAFRRSFAPLSEEMGVLIRTFRLGEGQPIYRLRCSMAFKNRGAIWFQADDETRNPYFGASMLKCADEVKRIVPEPPPAKPGEHTDHQQHQHSADQ